MNWTIFRAGVFEIETKGKYHCGAKTGRATFSYEARLEVEGIENLDERGFVVDNVEIDKVFQSAKQTHLSCEMLGLEYAKRIVLLLGDRVSGAKSCQVIISGCPRSAAVVTWNKGDSLKLLSIQTSQVGADRDSAETPDEGEKKPFVATPVPGVFRGESVYIGFDPARDRGESLAKKNLVISQVPPSPEEMRGFVERFGSPSGASVHSGSIPNVSEMFGAMGFELVAEEVTPDTRAQIFEPMRLRIEATPPDEMQLLWDQTRRERMEEGAAALIAVSDLKGKRGRKKGKKK